ncbi:AlpA family transcriptional regulator [Moritella viscosa]|uniref:Predicted transcriptional regulator n=1 Tax=Moritella viscosa TaxID=80854 RepID=A0A1L0ARV5_9GAMM|nr:AlpA family transcriptional regulator [Moritella viscosa]SGZ19792.1 Predicted transcriptional regulator [Moritella viscosa]SHO18169.1 Predicted transcriptional regulator [Moritella viscosa]
MKFIRLTEVKKMTGLGRSSIYSFMADGSFPQTVSLGGRAVAWVEKEVEEWMFERIAKRDLNVPLSAS